MSRTMIEAMAQERGWVVKYADDGTPSFFYPIYKCTSQSLDASLPATTHPAFIVNGVEIPRVLVGVYKGSEINGAIHSLPMGIPRVSLGQDALLAKCKAAGAGFAGNTTAISGLLYLMAKKNAWVHKGNNNNGADYRDGTKWATGASVTAGNKRIFQGREFTCLVNHTTALDNKPDITPAYWSRGKLLGGIPVASTISAAAYNGLTTLTGSGPQAWALGNIINGIVDLNGNCYEQDYGYRIYGGEIQILPNNDALDPAANLAANSPSWKAILPNAGDEGYTLVAPGTAGTLKWDMPANVPTLDTTITTRAANKSVAFTSLTKAAGLAFVPTIMKELGLFPILPDTTTLGLASYSNTDAVEYIPQRGGYYGNTSAPNFVNCLIYRSTANTLLGVRSAFLET